MSTKIINIFTAVFIAFSGVLYAGDQVSKKACTVATHDGDSMDEIASASIDTLTNVFPITIAGVDINPTGGEDSPSGDSDPICICPEPPPVYEREGITLSLWEPLLIAEPTAIPYCSPVIGEEMSISQGSGAKSYGQNETEGAKFTHTYQAHIIRYPVFALLGMLLDDICLESDGSMDYMYLTELDPLWQNDIWAAIIGPEAFLVANPIAEMACIADAIASNIGFPLDSLWWCIGSWNGSFPMTQTNKGTTAAEAQAAITARILMKLHRELLLEAPTLCGFVPQPIMQKSQYGIFPVYPISWDKRIPIGRSGLILWGAGQESPANQHVGAWMIYRKRTCCAS